VVVSEPVLQPEKVLPELLLHPEPVVLSELLLHPGPIVLSEPEKVLQWFFWGLQKVLSVGACDYWL
jgi:hypothetical protein